MDDASLHWLYSNCFAFLDPTLLEGFGLPVLEAMSLGAATITSNITSLPEIIDSAGIQVDPYNEADILNAMESLAANEPLRQELKANGLERARLFSWDKYARTTLSVCEKVMAIGKRA